MKNYELFKIETYEFDNYTKTYEWNTYTQTPIFDQAAGIMKHLGEIKQKARMRFFDPDGTEQIFFNYDIAKTPESVQIVF